MNQNPNLLDSLDLSTYSWMCCWSTGSSTTSLVLNETYLEGSKSAGLCFRAPNLALAASIYLTFIIKAITLTSFSFSTTFTILPKEGITLMLMLLKLVKNLPVGTYCVLEWHYFVYDILFIYLLNLHVFTKFISYWIIFYTIPIN